MLCAIEHTVKEYQAPFEAEVGLCPSLEDMQQLVVVRQQRPQISDEWLQDAVSYIAVVFIIIIIIIIIG